MTDKIGTLELIAETNGPIWFINHFLETTSSNYLKIVSLREICRRFAEGAVDDDFVIAANSFELLPEDGAKQYYKDEVVALESKARSADNFWRLFRALHRPIVLYNGRPVFVLQSDSALQLKKLSINSPLSVSLQGSAGALADLVSGNLLAQRQNERISQSIGNVQQIVQTSHLIEDPRTPEGVRAFAIDQLEALMKKQDRVNHQLGIREVRLKPH